MLELDCLGILFGDSSSKNIKLKREKLIGKMFELFGVL